MFCTSRCSRIETRFLQRTRTWFCRHLATDAATVELKRKERPATAGLHVFDQETKRWQRNHAARQVNQSGQVDYLRDEVAERLVDRILDIKRDFGKVLDLGSGAGHIDKFIDDDMMKELVMADTAKDALYRDAKEKREHAVPTQRHHLTSFDQLPFGDNAFSAVLSNLYMHWINDLPTLLREIHRVLIPDGVLLGAMLGGDTLYELRCALQLAEQEMTDGLAAHVSPMIASSDLAGLLKSAGYVVTTVDVDDIVVRYPSMKEVMHDLKAMGESNAIATRRPYLSPKVLKRAAEIYMDMYGATTPERHVTATFQVHFFIGWKPSSTTRQPLQRGSASHSLKKVLE